MTLRDLIAKIIGLILELLSSLNDAYGKIVREEFLELTIFQAILSLCVFIIYILLVVGIVVLPLIVLAGIGEWIVGIYKEKKERKRRERESEESDRAFEESRRALEELEREGERRNIEQEREREENRKARIKRGPPKLIDEFMEQFHKTSMDQHNKNLENNPQKTIRKKESE